MFKSVSLCVLLLATISVAQTAPKTYATQFSATENPLSEGGNWFNGKTDGLDWSNVQSASGLAFGTQTNGGYNDSVAILKGTWAADHKVQATVRRSNSSTSYYPEVELWLRGKVSPHQIRGYEINFSAGGTYQEIVRWNGPLNNFTYLGSASLGRPLASGDVVTATIVGNVITVYRNGVQINQVTDSTYADGSPGIGFYHNAGGDGTDSQYAFDDLTVTELSTSSATPPPTAPPPSTTPPPSSGGTSSSYGVVGTTWFRNSLAAPVANAQTSGNYNVLAIEHYGNSISSVTDTMGNKYTRACGPFSTGDQLTTDIEFWVSGPIVAAAGGQNTVRINMNATPQYKGAVLYEVHAANGLVFDKCSSRITQSSSSANSGETGTTSYGNSFVVAVTNPSYTGISAPGSPWVNDGDPASTSSSYVHRFAPGGSYSATWTSTSSQEWNSAIAVFGLK